MLRIFNSVIRSSLHSSWCAVIPNQHIQCCGLKQSIEEKLNIPPKPKRPLTPFFRFMIKTRPTFRQQYPNASGPEILKLIGKEWETMDPNVKLEMEKSFRQEFDSYSTELSEYKQKLSPEQLSAIQNAKDEIATVKNKLKLKKKTRLLGKPKKPKSSFLLFLDDNKSLRGTMHIKEWVASMVTKWHQLGESEKQQYAERGKKAMEKYAEDLRKWEVNMIKSGHLDVVRKESQIVKSRPTVKDRK